MTYGYRPESSWGSAAGSGGNSKCAAQRPTYKPRRASVQPLQIIARMAALVSSGSVGQAFGDNRQIGGASGTKPGQITADSTAAIALQSPEVFGKSWLSSKAFDSSRGYLAGGNVRGARRLACTARRPLAREPACTTGIVRPDLSCFSC